MAELPRNLSTTHSVTLFLQAGSAVGRCRARRALEPQGVLLLMLPARFYVWFRMQVVHESQEHCADLEEA